MTDDKPLNLMTDEELADLYCKRKEFANNSKTEQYFKAIEAEFIKRGYTPSTVTSLKEWMQLIAKRKSNLELFYWLKYKKLKKIAHDEIKHRNLSKATIKELKMQIEDSESDNMLMTLNGFGTMLYGCADKLNDGSYVATRWVVFLFIPVIPLKSYRIFSKEGGFFDFVVSYNFKREYLNKKQIIRTYLLVFGILLFIILLVHFT